MGLTAKRCGVFLTSVLALCACAGNSASAFPDGLGPLDDTNQAALPAAKDGDPHPETVGTAVGETDDYVWAHVRGYVHAPLAKTFAAMHTADVCVDRRKVDEWQVTPNVESTYRWSQRVHNVVHSIATIEFDVTWREDAVTGTFDAPESVAGRWMKTYGSTYIGLMAGSMVARKVDDQTTELELIEHLSAHGQGSDTALSFLVDYFASVVAVAHDQPLPKY